MHCAHCRHVGCLRSVCLPQGRRLLGFYLVSASMYVFGALGTLASRQGAGRDFCVVPTDVGLCGSCPAKGVSPGTAHFTPARPRPSPCTEGTPQPWQRFSSNRPPSDMGLYLCVGSSSLSPPPLHHTSAPQGPGLFLRPCSTQDRGELGYGVAGPWWACAWS